MLAHRQLLALLYKNWLIAVVRRPVTTVLRALILPVVFGWLLSYARNFFVPSSVYGFGSPSPVLALQDAYSQISSRSQLVFVRNNYTGGDIERVISNVGAQAQAAGKTVLTLDNTEDLLTTCRSSLLGTTNCLGAIVFYGSPTEGPSSVWNYTLRGDGSLGTKIDVTSNRNDPELYILPLQRAVDNAIAILDRPAGIGRPLPPAEEYPFTSLTQAQRDTRIRNGFSASLVSILAVGFYLAICGVTYQLVGLQATERELGISQLTESMMPYSRPWVPQAVRLLAYHLFFSLLYLPGWIILAVIIKTNIFAATSLGLLVGYHILAGLSTSSAALFVGAFFRKAQISGICAIGISIILAIVAQIENGASSRAVYVLSLLFPSMNYTFAIIYMARFQTENQPTDLMSAAPNSPSTVPGYVFFIFLVIQALVYPLLAVATERLRYGTVGSPQCPPGESVAIDMWKLTKTYAPAWYRRFGCFGKSETITAVNNVDIQVTQSQLVMLLGSNGSGKSTLQGLLSGSLSPTSGHLAIDRSQGIGVCPQENRTWPSLTVAEHAHIFAQLKAQDRPPTKTEVVALIEACDLGAKVNSRAGALSGGQLRKLQLCIAFLGGSKICLIDEASSGLDPRARNKILNILTAERQRSKRTIIYTSHYLDEAEIADRIIILSKGSVRLDDSVPRIKETGDYRLHVFQNSDASSLSIFEGLECKKTFDQRIYTIPTREVSCLLARLEETEPNLNFTLSGPSIENAFIDLAEEMSPAAKTTGGSAKLASKEQSINLDVKAVSDAEEDALKLDYGQHVGVLRLSLVLFRKRALIFRRNIIPLSIPLCLLPLGAGLFSLFITNFQGIGCDPASAIRPSTVQDLQSQLQSNFDLVIGPGSKLSGLPSIAQDLLSNATRNGTSSSLTAGSGLNLTAITEKIHTVDTLDNFTDYVNLNYHILTGGILFKANASTLLIWRGNGIPALPFIIQNIAGLVNGITIAAQYQPFEIPFPVDAGSTLQFIVYLGLVLTVCPAFFSLYPCLERLRGVRGLQYSNGVRAPSLWLAHLSFDSIFIVFGAALATIILRALSSIWYGLGQLFVVMTLYGVTSALMGYFFALFASSQLAAFAISAGFNTISLLIYFIAYLSAFTWAPIQSVDNVLLIVHFTISIVFPSGSMMRALFVGLNELQVNCRGPNVYAASPSDLRAYGGPILYLIVQGLFLFAILVWWESSSALAIFSRKKSYIPHDEDRVGPRLTSDVAAEVRRVETTSNDSLRVLHLTKTFGRLIALSDVSFGVARGEILGLLGVNGAGKSTCLSCIRGELAPSTAQSAIYVEGVSIRHLAKARQKLGFCPQFDAIDNLTVEEHLALFARVRGVERARVQANVDELIRATGLQAYKSRMAMRLSGGAKRKLGLAIALMGNPDLLLLDEPSSGLDIAAKRLLWQTLLAIAPGRAVVLISHSLEEADYLCRRAAIISQRILAIGSCDELRRAHGHRFHVHLLLKTAPYTTDEESEWVRSWILRTFTGAELPAMPFHGQIRFSVPTNSGPQSRVSTAEKPGLDAGDDDAIASTVSVVGPKESVTSQLTTSTVGHPRSNIVHLFNTLEANKEAQGIASYTVSQTSLNDVFLQIVGEHSSEREEAQTSEVPSHRSRWRWWRRKTHYD